MNLLKWVALAALALVAACSTTGSTGSRDFQFGQDYTACLNRPLGCNDYPRI